MLNVLNQTSGSIYAMALDSEVPGIKETSIDEGKLWVKECLATGTVDENEDTGTVDAGTVMNKLVQLRREKEICWNNSDSMSIKDCCYADSPNCLLKIIITHIENMLQVVLLTSPCRTLISASSSRMVTRIMGVQEVVGVFDIKENKEVCKTVSVREIFLMIVSRLFLQKFSLYVKITACHTCDISIQLILFLSSFQLSSSSFSFFNQHITINLQHHQQSKSTLQQHNSSQYLPYFNLSFFFLLFFPLPYYSLLFVSSPSCVVRFHFGTAIAFVINTNNSQFSSILFQSFLVQSPLPALSSVSADLNCVGFNLQSIISQKSFTLMLQKIDSDTFLTISFMCKKQYVIWFLMSATVAWPPCLLIFFLWGPQLFTVYCVQVYRRGVKAFAIKSTWNLPTVNFKAKALAKEKSKIIKNNKKFIFSLLYEIVYMSRLVCPDVTCHLVIFDWSWWILSRFPLFMGFILLTFSKLYENIFSILHKKKTLQLQRTRLRWIIDNESVTIKFKFGKPYTLCLNTAKRSSAVCIGGITHRQKLFGVEQISNQPFPTTWSSSSVLPHVAQKPTHAGWLKRSDFLRNVDMLCAAYTFLFSLFELETVSGSGRAHPVTWIFSSDHTHLFKTNSSALKLSIDFDHTSHLTSVKQSSFFRYDDQASHWSSFYILGASISYTSLDVASDGFDSETLSGINRLVSYNESSFWLLRRSRLSLDLLHISSSHRQKNLCLSWSPDSRTRLLAINPNCTKLTQSATLVTSLDQSVLLPVEPAHHFFVLFPIGGVGNNGFQIMADDCPICLSTLAEQVEQWPGCGHKFHPACLQNWRKTKRDNSQLAGCPSCRRPEAAETSSRVKTVRVRANTVANEVSTPQILTCTRCFRESLFSSNQGEARCNYCGMMLRWGPYVALPGKCHKNHVFHKILWNVYMKGSRKQSDVSPNALLNSCVCQSGIHPKPIWNTLLIWSNDSHDIVDIDFGSLAWVWIDERGVLKIVDEVGHFTSFQQSTKANSCKDLKGKEKRMKESIRIQDGIFSFRFFCSITFSQLTGSFIFLNSVGIEPTDSKGEPGPMV
ncbi:uncharacterized protein VP01_2693g1 [Puccinia sorghi]|uniref:RING-type domain-containing protein n=1 Tax=Puccinia sorghi TaxID=27349 RepID=A0A0L6V3R8_9BASI|nr:uncharacterized protein VP01_2693g1 [Puccinia sorghi]